MAPLQAPPTGRKLVYLWLLSRFLGFILLLPTIGALSPLLKAIWPAQTPSPHRDGFAAGFDEGQDMIVLAFMAMCIIVDFWVSLSLFFMKPVIERALAAPSHRWQRLAQAVSVPYLLLVATFALAVFKDVTTRWQEMLVSLPGALPYLAATLAAATLLYRKHLFSQPSGHPFTD